MMSHIYQDGLIDGQDVRYWHKQYIERRDAGDKLTKENAALKRELADEKENNLEYLKAVALLTGGEDETE